jgi:D-alanyl-D-alanine carboxypeptidase
MGKISAIAFIFLTLSFFIQAQGFDPILAGKLQNTVDSIRTVKNLKGISACVIYPGQGAWKGVSGISHPGVPITSGMEFGIASNTKLFTGVLLLKLAENNLLDLDDSLHSFLPTYNNIDPNITIRQLLNHTSGLADVTSVPGYPDSILTNPDRIFTPGELMTWAGPPLFAAGTGWSYCNTNYLLAGMIAESVTGQSYGRLLRDSILTPLQLDSTFLDVYDTIPYAIAHPWQGGADNSSIPRKALNSAAWAAGAMYSTSGEMAQWYHALMSGQVINTASINEMTTFVGSGNYGIGLSRATIMGRTVWQHGGTIWGGYNSSMMYDTATGAVICVLVNQLPAQAFQIAIQLLSTLVSNPVSTAENSPGEAYVRACPNPASDFVHIDTPGCHVQSISIINPAGQLVRASSEAVFSVKDFPVGLYYLSVQTDRGTHICKLIRQ